MKKIILPILIFVSILSIIGIHNSNETSFAKLVICKNDPSLCNNANYTVNFAILNNTINSINLSGCANGQVHIYQSSNSTWICGANGGVDTDNFLTSINGDTTAAQTLTGQSTNITATTLSGTTTFKLGTNIPVLGGSSQIFTKALSFSSGNKLTLSPSASTSGINIGTTSALQTSPRQGDLSIAGSLLKYNDNSNTTQTVGILSQAQTWLAKQTGTVTSSTASFNLGTLASDLTSPRQGDIRIVGTSLKYNDNSNGTQTITPSSYLTTAVTSATGTSNNVTVSASTGAVTWNLGSNVVMTGGSAQTITKNMFFSGNVDFHDSGVNVEKFDSGNIIVRNPAATFATQILNSAITHNRTLSLPLQTSNSTFAILDLAQSYTGKQTMTPTASTSGFNLGTISSDLTSPRQGDLRIAGTQLLYNDNSNNTQTLDNLGTAQTFTAKKTFTLTSTTAPINLVTSASNPTSPRQGDLWIAGNGLLYNDNGNTTRTAVITQLSQTISGGKTFSGANLVTTGSFDFQNTANSLKILSGGTTLRNPAGTFGYAIVTSAITKNITTTLPLANNNVQFRFQPIFNFTSPANQTGTTSLVRVMLGGYATLTPRYSTNATISVSGYLTDSLTADGCIVDIRTSSSFLGANGATLSGTLLGGNIRTTQGVAAEKIPFSKTVIYTGNVVGTKQYYDLSFAAITGGTCTVNNVDWAIIEQ